MSNKELASLFSTIALYLEIEDVPFKPQAYERAAGVLETLQERVEDIYEREGVKGLDKISGVGKGMAEKIEEYIKTGAIGEYEKLRKKIPIDIKELTRIEGVGPKMVRDLYKHLKIKTIADLEKAAKAGKVRKLPNFGERTEQNILQGIEFVKRSKGRWLLGTIFPYVEVLLGKLEGSPFVTRAIAAGSIRRMKETVGDVDILITSEKPEKAIGYFLSVVSYEKIWGKGATKVSVRTREGFDIDMRVLPEEVFGAGLQYFTGSKEHNVRLRTYAASKGYKLSEYGLFRGKRRIVLQQSQDNSERSRRIACATEEDVYRALGMNYIEPELREDHGEIDAALRQAQGKLPGLPKVIPYGSLKGDLQVQTDWTDGKDSIEAMAREAKKQGLEYIAITDHTRDLAMTGGMDEKKLLSQMREIDKINEKFKAQGEKFRVLKGAEVNIRKDGTLDITDEVLAKLDVVGISVHSNFKMPKKDMTARIVKAMGNPHADILFHPTGRLIAKREAYQVDMDEIIATAKKTGTILEINAFPERLDLADSNIKRAVEAGCKMAIDSDAHSISHLGYLRYGVAQARRGWAEQQDIINSYPLKEMLSLLK
ncbi:MAG: DNA polymerase III [Candidatus Wildermuthbacteria bacterium RIFCSPHIGHO2_01_FULL_48_27b]|uniref:DNA polymerase beta n=1 Tax=Candidatus Wildermuthbacteria bacterium RIFCSPHIGHO2_01_FULL_48_27b TaxID=1802447 RepID=A0A1G2QT21_9BACT|nr:MAG: DNA polymerase III [Candidatus Wildermuthbacteria bacterium RIFCSPHIGHO2_01_FULL_48_27b]